MADLTKDLTEGLEESLDLEDSLVTDTDDGGAIVKLDDEADAPGPTEHFTNLAEDAGKPELMRLGTELVEMIERDKEARSKRDEQYEEGLRRTGLGEDAPGGAVFKGASKVVHPMLVEACIDFSARSMKEIFPSGGPVKDYIQGRVTEEKVAKAQRKSALLNWQLTVQCPEVRSELEQMMTQVPLGGAQYLKVNWDMGKNRPTFLFVAIDDMYLPFAATNFYSAQRKTHVQYLTALDYERRVKSGMYREVDLIASSNEPEESKSGTASDKIEGREQTSYNEDGLRIVYECHATMDVGFDEDTEGPAPYIVTVDKTSNEVLAVYRNWAEDDEQQEELAWFVEWPFVPWRGAYPIGLPHMIGGLSGAATGALRALLDSAHINNSASMLKLKGGIGGQNISVQPTEIVEIEGTFNVDDIRKLAMPMPFNPPSAVLFQLLGFLVDAGKGVVRTSMEDIADGSPNAPVGTTLAKLEQGMVVYSSIHQRLHDSMARLLRVLHRLNGQNLDEVKLKDEAGEVLATRRDFQGPLDVVPVSDPNIFSETQRFAQVQAVAGRAEAHPELYNARKVEERILDTLKVPNPDDLLSPSTDPKAQNAVNENVAASLGRPIVAFPEQDHVAHVKTHLTFLMSPMFGANKLIAAKFIPAILGHLAEHLVMWYAASVFEVSNESLGEGKDVGEMMRDLGKDAEGRKALDRMLAEASTLVVLDGTEVFVNMAPLVKQAEALLKTMQPPPQENPLVEIEKAKIQQRSEADAAKLQAQGQAMQAKTAAEQQALQAKAQSEAAALQAKQQLEQAKLSVSGQAKVVGEQAKGQAKQAELQTKQELEQQRLLMEAQDREAAAAQAHQSLAVQLSTLQQKQADDAAKRDAEAEQKELDRESAERMNTQDNQTALEIAGVKADADVESATSAPLVEDTDGDGE